MKNKVLPISFKSNIKLITPLEFAQKTKHLSKEIHEADYPWSPDQIKEGKILFTQKVMDCVAGGIVGKTTAKLFHQGHWTEENAKQFSQKVFDVKELEEKLLEGFDLANEKIHGLILGGFGSVKTEFTDKIKNIFRKHKIPFSEITTRKDVHHYGRYSLLYEHDTDTWSITSTLMDVNDLKNTGKAVFLNGSEVEYATYGKAEEGYPLSRNKGSVEDFFKSQFVDVSLNKFDKFIMM